MDLQHSQPPEKRKAVDYLFPDGACDPKHLPPTRHSETAARDPAALAHSGQNTATSCNAERVTLSVADGYPITGIRYTGSGPARANLIVAGATGVPQRFYRRFANFAASRGYSTMTLDYRGIGLSAPPTLRGFRMDYVDWGRLDLAAAVDAMSSSGVPLYMVAHSYGGHAFGLLPNHERVARFYTFGTGAGWHGWMPPLERIKVWAMWHLLGPLLTWKGYLSWSMLGMGEDLPLDFYRQWKRWCRYPNYFFGDPSMQHLALGFARVRTPMMAANSIDDRWSPPRSRDAFMVGYRNAARQTLDIDHTASPITHLLHQSPLGVRTWMARFKSEFSTWGRVRCACDRTRSSGRVHVK